MVSPSQRAPGLSFTTFFFRNRLLCDDLLARGLGRKQKGASVSIAAVACSKGAEVYSTHARFDALDPI